MADPAVTVLMPVRDAAPTLDEALDSILGQTLEALELVAVDDGSTDGSTALLRARAARDPRLRVLSRPPRGIVAALNEGLAAARAPIVARMDADDVALPGRLAAQAALLDARPGVAVAGCLVECFPRATLPDGMRRYEAWLNALVEPGEIAADLFVESPLAHPSVAFRRSVVEAAGGYRDGPFPEDYDLWLRLHGAGCRFAKVPEVLLRWRDGPGRLTRTDPRYGAGAFRALKARHLVRGPLAGRDAVQACGAGPDARRWGRALEAEGVRVARWFDVDPRKVGRRVQGAPVLAWTEVAGWRDLPLVCAVGRKGARQQIREALVALGRIEGVDFVCVQ